MISSKLLILTTLAACAARAAAGQVTLASPTPKVSDALSQKLTASRGAETPAEKKAQAYAKLLEGQRYIWKSNPMRSQSGAANNAKLAKAAIQAAVELDPTLAEGYTALAELAISTPPSDIDEAINLALIATKIQPNNFGGHRILARLYTYKSQLHNGIVNQIFAAKAITEWKEVARLDPRNAEAWAFLSEFYDNASKPAEQIDALRKWVAAATPLESQFYRRVMGGRETLSPESATTKLATALIRNGKSKEAVEVLAILIADDPDNSEALNLLREALENAGSDAGGIAVESLQQAAFANPENTAIVVLLAQVQARNGKTDEAVKLLRETSAKLAASDKVSASSLQVSLGDIYSGTDRVNEAVAAYEKAFELRGIKEGAPVAERDREFVMQVFEKMIRAYKLANRTADVRAVIQRARKLLGKEDLFADRQSILLFRESGDRAAALAAVQNVRKRIPDDYGFLRLEASVLTEMGRIDEAVAMIRKLSMPVAMPPKTVTDGGIISVPSPVYDDFSNQLFIAQLYSQANKPKEAAEAANQAYSTAKGQERKQLAKLTLATAQQMAGDYKGAEATLREILKQTPGNPIALNNLGYFMLERGDRIDEALELIRQAVAIDPTNPSYLDSLGWGYFKHGKLNGAESKLREAARYDPASPVIQEHLGDVYEKQGKSEQARATWQRALALTTDAANTERLRNKLSMQGSK